MSFRRTCLSTITLTTCFLFAVPAAQGAIVDPANDFLPSYTAAATNPDLDVISANATWDPSTRVFGFEARMAGDLGQTAGALYVWGLDRGQGTERFVAGSPSIGAGVSFDSVLILRPDGTGLFNDFINAAVTNLAPGAVRISGDTISTAPLPLSLFPSTGLQPAEYTWNLWPRVGLGSNTQITDFAPDGSNAGFAVPEPAGWALVATGALLLRRRSPISVVETG